LFSNRILNLIIHISIKVLKQLKEAVLLQKMTKVDGSDEAWFVCGHLSQAEPVVKPASPSKACGEFLF